MKEKNRQKSTKKRGLTASRECAYLAVFVALVIGAQLCLSVFLGVELVTVLFIAYSFAFGARRGMAAATVFSLLRQFLFGFYPVVLILYLVYYNLLALLFGLFGHKVRKPKGALWWLLCVACLCTASFTLLDDIVTPLWYGYSKRAAEAYFYASLSVMLPQIVCTAVTVGVLFLPLERVFSKIATRLKVS